MFSVIMYAAEVTCFNAFPRATRHFVKQPSRRPFSEFDADDGGQDMKWVCYIYLGEFWVLLNGVDIDVCSVMLD